MITKTELENLYLVKKHSSAEIGKLLDYSERKIVYWLKKYGIPKRSVSEAIYLKHNPKGDPFKIREPKDIKEAVLFGLGLGLYWGEGTKSNKSSVRLGNTDPELVRTFVKFLIKTYGIRKEKLKFGLQIFSDMEPYEALTFWQKKLRASPSQFQKVIVTPARSLGTYRYKTKHGVLTVYYNNTKLRNLLIKAIEEI